MENRGSIWRKWDLHVHTKGTNKNDQFKASTMDEFFDIFFVEAVRKKIYAIGVTDYFTIDKYLEATKYKKRIITGDTSRVYSKHEIDFISNIFLFPNVELRIIPVTKKGKQINLHFLFNPDYVSSLQNNFFNELKNSAGYQMNTEGFISFAKSIQGDGKNIDYKKEGIKLYNLEFSSIIKLLNQKNELRKNALIAVSSKSNDGVSGLRDFYQEIEGEDGSLMGVIKGIYRKTDIVFSGAPSDKNYFLGKKKKPEDVINEVGSLKPCVIGSDAHTENDLFNRFTWIKADLHFEGLRQISLEPESRVLISNDLPEFKEEKLVIDSIQFTNKKKVFTTNPIYLNPNLNVIIGGKSSGKSIFLYCIARTLLSDHNSLIADKGIYKYNLEEIDPSFNFQIHTKGGFSQQMIRNEENSIIPEIKYIPQNYLVKLAEPELSSSGKNLNKIIRDLLLEDEGARDRYNEFLTVVKENDRIRRNQIDNYLHTHEEIEELYKELKTKSNKEILLKNISTNTQKVEELNKSVGLNDEEVLRFNEIQKSVEEVSLQKRSLLIDFNSTRIFLAETKNSITEIKQKTENHIKNIKTESVKDHYANELKSITSLLTQLNKLNSEVQTTQNSEGKTAFHQTNIFHEQFQFLNTKENTFNNELQPFLSNEEVKKKVFDINLSIKEDKLLLDDIELLSNNLNEKRTLTEELSRMLIKQYKLNYSEYNSIVNSFLDRTKQLQKDGLTITGHVKFNFSKLRERLMSASDKRSASYLRYRILNSDKTNTENVNIEEIVNDITQLFRDTLSGDYVTTSKISNREMLLIIFDDYFFDYWDIEYKGDKLGKMSTGKASFVILMLIIGLSKSKAPILIDQPEDNLDNRSISEDLVKYLKAKKSERQIILVSHNANVVVNADAENIIVANQTGQGTGDSNFRFNYVNGSIENSFEFDSTENDILKSMGIRQHIAEILEGGEQAFIMREKKYRFHN
ncbi:MAG TPA: hypothetical protein DCR93_01770 [Cytophagales bacterium]|nr:hypothetical protein [Cytophagales bacterium]HAP58280.1 hypothetical protein [Cytophagales bacterium]